MSLSWYLSGMLLVACAALLGTLGVIAEQEWPTWRAFREERAHVVYAAPSPEELVGLYEDRLETLALYESGPAIATRVDYAREPCDSGDDDYYATTEAGIDEEEPWLGWPSVSSRRGTWALAGDRLTVTSEAGTSELHYGHLDGEPVLVGSSRVWRRVRRP